MGGRPLRDPGVALLAVLVIAFVVGASSLSFIWFMNQLQARAGARYRSAAALAVAEAGVHRALAMLEAVAPAPGLSGRTWRSPGRSETVWVGAFEGRFILWLAEDPDGATIIISTGEAGGVTRRLRARAYVPSTALLAALYGEGIVRLERSPAATVILPYGAGLEDRPWMHIAAGRGIWFATTGVSINDPSAFVDTAAGPVDPSGPAGASSPLPPPGPVRLLLAPGADLMFDRDLHPIDIQHLRANGVYVNGVILRSKAFPNMPDVDRLYYQAQAAANTSNAAVNQAAGQYLGDGQLARKADGLYTSPEIDKVLAYLSTGLRPPQLRGVVYVKGPVSLSWWQQLKIEDGGLVAEGTVAVGQGASLEISHTSATRTLPGIIVLDGGGLVVTQEARVQAHGLVYAGGMIEVSEGARLDIVGSVLAGDRGLSFHAFASTVLIRYDPAVLGTPGLRVPPGTPIIAWVASWEELP